MLRRMKKSKIHRATVTDANLNYVGSITIDKTLLKAADILPGEQVHVVNINNGSRAVTYVIEGEENSGEICMNGAIARNAEVGDIVIIITYADVDNNELADFKGVNVLVDKDNKIETVTYD